MNDLPDFDEWDNSDTSRNNQEFEINNSVESIAFIEQLKSSSKEIMMELIYKAIIENEMGALNNSTPVEEKIAALETVIKYFVEKEEYERCHELKKIISNIC
jgi:replication-associated recombination protein RarA